MLQTALTLQLARDQLLIESRLRDTETRLNAARQAEEYLELQKAENLSLREEMDRLRLDVDQSRLRAVASTTSLSRSVSGSSSASGSLSRTLGVELQHRLLGIGAAPSDMDRTISAPARIDTGERRVASDASFTEETVVRVRHHRRKPDRKISPSSSLRRDSVDAAELASLASIDDVSDTDEETDVIVRAVDAGVQAPIEPRSVVAASVQTSPLALRELLGRELDVSVHALDAALDAALSNPKPAPPPYTTTVVHTAPSMPIAPPQLTSSHTLAAVFVLGAMLAILLIRLVRLGEHVTTIVCEPPSSFDQAAGDWFAPSDRAVWVQQLAFTLGRYSGAHRVPT